MEKEREEVSENCDIRLFVNKQQNPSLNKELIMLPQVRVGGDFKYGKRKKNLRGHNQVGANQSVIHLDDWLGGLHIPKMELETLVGTKPRKISWQVVEN